ncbi:hypothetical protein [Clostridium sp. AM29-11AC]|uniref:hypothetical protein n=1 Tax=Clostridium sp. AM29-11AC TaxID=2293028 RepID=UPI0011C2359F|nr:hypothetical protein [Clostridium sp. AM29-11AC]
MYKNKTAPGSRGKWILKKELNFHTYLSDLHTEKPHMQKKEWIPDITSQLKEGYQRFFSANTPPGIKDPFSVPLHLHAPPIFCISASKYCLQPYTADFFLL